ncbi:MAG: hypothetical protein WBC06_12130 [Chitinophagaceae bacterium]
MTIIDILGDGTVYPPLRKQDLIIRIQQGKICVGRFDRQNFMTDSENYLNEPVNAADLKADAIAFISAEMPGLFRKIQTVHLICPTKISAKAEWQTFVAINSSIFTI